MFRAHYVDITARCITRVYPLKVDVHAYYLSLHNIKIDTIYVLLGIINSFEDICRCRFKWETYILSYAV